MTATVKVQHTKGPWCVETAMSNRAFDIALDYQIPEAGSPVLVASVYCDEPQEVGMAGFISPEEAEANARVMAAGPELLEALWHLVQWQAEVAHAVPLAWLEKASAAIAKAGGK